MLRLVVKWLIPGAINGTTDAELLANPFDLAAMDRTNNNVRMRQGVMIVRGDTTSTNASVIYFSNGQFYRATAKAEIFAGQSHTARTACARLLSASQADTASVADQPNERIKLLTTRFSSYEDSLRADLNRVLAGRNFDFDRDVTAVYLYRWGHSMVYPKLGWPFSAPVNKKPRQRNLWVTDAFEWRPEVGPRPAAERRIARTQLFVFVASWLWNHLASLVNATPFIGVIRASCR